MSSSPCSTFRILRIASIHERFIQYLPTQSGRDCHIDSGTRESGRGRLGIAPCIVWQLTRYATRGLPTHDGSTRRVSCIYPFRGLVNAAQDPQVAAFLRRPNFQAVEALVGHASDGSPLQELLDEATAGQAEEMVDLLARNMALGIHPRVTAKQMQAQFAVSLRRAQTIARTETLRAYRAASQMTMQENDDVLDGWIWISACDRRSCISCIAQHGTWHPLSERLQDHVNGRCVAAPAVRGVRPKIQTGAERFAKWKPEEQRAALGGSAYEAYRDGAIQLEDMVGRTHSDRWGDSVHVRSLRSVVGQERALQYADWGRVRTEVLAELASQPSTPKHLMQVDRLVEVRAMGQGAVQPLFESVRQSPILPRLEQHFQKHGKNLVSLGVEDAQGYADYLVGHLNRDDLRVFTFVTTKATQDRMWVFVGVDNGVIAQYNETKHSLWSFFRQMDIDELLLNTHNWWVAVVKDEAGIRFEPW